MRHHRRKRKAQKPQPAPVAKSKLVFFSAAVFTTSILVFVHQCIRPFAAFPRALSSGNFLPTSGQEAHVLDSSNVTSLSSKPRNWFSGNGIGLSQRKLWTEGESNFDNSQQASTDGTPAKHERATKSVGVVDVLESIPEGPYPLPLLRNTTAADQKDEEMDPPDSAPGYSWSGSLARGVLSVLPLHWVAEAVHAAPQKEEGPAQLAENDNSIFAARRKGAWIGCSRPFHLVCKGVYRAIKITNSVHIVDVSCQQNAGWLPHILQKLRGEFRLVHLTCVVGKNVNREEMKQEYASVENLNFVEMDPFKDTFPNQTDMVVAYRFLKDGTLISAMRFFKNVKASGSVKLLATETFPGQRNVLKKQPSGNTQLQINTKAAPFRFPPSIYEYENADENPDSDRMQISVANVRELFKEKSTPEMQDLVDPRKRLVRE